MKKLTLLLAIFLVSFSLTNACSGSGETSFCGVNFNNPTWHVFIGKILVHDSLYSDFEVIVKIRGIELRDTVRIWDNPSQFNSCVGGNEVNTEFLGAIGDSILITLPKIDSVIRWGTIGDYYRPLGIFEKPFLPIRGGLIIGNLTKSHAYTNPPTPYIIDSISIQTFTTKYNSSGRSSDCDLFVGIPKNVIIQQNVIIYPNPSSGFFNIESEVKVKNIEVYNMSGSRYNFANAKSFDLTNQRKNSTSSESLDLTNFKSGIYFLKVELENGVIVTKKIIKQ